ncbi:MAG: hypothetical protein WCO67_25355, partial [Betaproteobacteria bacterium]
NTLEVLQQSWSSATVTLTGSAPATVPSTWRVSVGETDIEAQVGANADLNTIATALGTAINAYREFTDTVNSAGQPVRDTVGHLVYTASVTGAAITISRIDLATFSVEATKSYLVKATTTYDEPFSGNDQADDVITLNGGQSTSAYGDHSSYDDTFMVTTLGGAVRVAEASGPTFTFTNGLLKTATDPRTLSVSGTEPVFSSVDRLVIRGGAGNDILSGEGVVQDLMALHFIGGGGADQLTGSAYADVLDGGLGDDTFRGYTGVDLFYDAGGSDTLFEVFDKDMSLYGNTFVAGQIVGDTGGTFSRQSKVAEQAANTAAQANNASLTIRDGRENAVTPTTVSLVAPTTANATITSQVYTVSNAVTLTITATTGNVVLNDGLGHTATFAYNASAATIQTALQSMNASYASKIGVTDSATAGQKTIRFDLATPPTLAVTSGSAAITAIYQETDISLVGTVIAGQVWTLNTTSKDLSGATVVRNYSYTVGAASDAATMVVVAKRLAEMVNADTVSELSAEDAGPEPIIYGISDSGGRYAAGAEVESLRDARTGVDIFENATLTGGASKNILVVNDSDGTITIDGTGAGSGSRSVSDWQGLV